MALVVTPYLKDYKSAKEAKAAWEADHDFVIQTFGHPGEGKPTNRSNLKRMGDTGEVNIRFSKLRKVTVVKIY